MRRSQSRAVADRGGARARSGVLLPAAPDERLQAPPRCARGGGCVRARARGRRVAAHGSHWRLRARACRARRAAACRTPSGTWRACVRRIRPPRVLGRRRRRSRLGVRSARLSRPSRPAASRAETDSRRRRGCGRSPRRGARRAPARRASHSAICPTSSVAFRRAAARSGVARALDLAGTSAGACARARHSAAVLRFGSPFEAPALLTQPPRIAAAPYRARTRARSAVQII